MILFFKGVDNKYFAIQSKFELSDGDKIKLGWLFGATLNEEPEIQGYFVGPRKEMITPWSTNAVEITQNMGIEGIIRIEEFFQTASSQHEFDSMLQALYKNLGQKTFTIKKQPEPILYIDDVAAYSQKEGLALSEEEIQYLQDLSKKLKRKLTDSEIFGFSQVNSEHCRHKIFNGTFVIDGKEQESTLFQLIKKTTQANPNRVVSAYKDNCAFLQGPLIEQFAPQSQDKPDFFEVTQIESVLSLKAETHNFPTTVEPFNGAATGTGGEIRDRIGGGKGAIPIAGTAVYMTSYPRPNGGREWEKATGSRKWLYHTPEEILIKASNGASDFGNKYGQPLICGSVFTFEHFENGKKFGYDKVIMLAGGVGSGKKKDSIKDIPEKGDKIILLGGDNYRIGMGGGAVSSVATGEYGNAIELNAVQRSNPEMQKRVYNAIRALVELDKNPVISIHDHGAGGHLNCLSELVEATGGKIDMSKLPIGDPTLSAKEIAGNESQERMGLVIKSKDIELLKNIADRERAPFYVIGEITNDQKFTFVDPVKNEKPIDLKLEDMFGNPPNTVLTDCVQNDVFEEIVYDVSKLHEYLELVLQLESVACKDWLTNKVDRSVTGRVARQQTAGIIQLPLNNVAVVALDYKGEKGIATSLGHAPVAGLIDAENGSILSIAEALTNIIWAPIEGGMRSVSLSANWMWPCKNTGEDSRLYKAVKAASDFALALGVNIPTGKDSLSMTQKYPDGDVVYSPGTVIISAAGEVSDIKKVLSPVLINDNTSLLIYIDLSSEAYTLGGSSLGQVLNKIGTSTPTVKDPTYFANVFNTIQLLINEGKILAGHDISSGGMITTLLEMVFANPYIGLEIDLSSSTEKDIIKLLFSENPGIIVQVGTCDKEAVAMLMKQKEISVHIIGKPVSDRIFNIKKSGSIYSFDIDRFRDVWYKTSYLMDRKQSGEQKAMERYNNYKAQPLTFMFKESFTGKLTQYNIDIKRRMKSGINAAIIREKGVNGDREMAWMMHLAGFDVKDVHMTDLISGRETLEDINLIVFVGGFSNSDVLGSAKGWAGAFLYNSKAQDTLRKFYDRHDTLSLGVCNGCQLMIELGLINTEHKVKPKMQLNESHKFESGFINVTITENYSVMLKSLSGSRLGAWVAHGEGKFNFPYDENRYHVVMKYSYSGYPGNPNGSNYDVAGLCSSDGRHLAMMPHLERAIYPWNWALYTAERKNDEVSPWIEAFVNAREWIKDRVTIGVFGA
jgi:phosphoribosylformylglycinamidine synthase